MKALVVGCVEGGYLVWLTECSTECISTPQSEAAEKAHYGRKRFRTETLYRNADRSPSAGACTGYGEAATLRLHGRNPVRSDLQSIGPG